MADEEKEKAGMKKASNKQGIGQTYKEEFVEEEELEQEELEEIKTALITGIGKGTKKLKKLYEEIIQLNKISVLTAKNQKKREKTGDVNDQNQARVSKAGQAKTKTSLQLGETRQPLPAKGGESQRETMGAFTEIEMMLKKGATKTITVLQGITKIPAMFKQKLAEIAKKQIDNIMGRSL